jgi:hypothetical protein
MTTPPKYPPTAEGEVTPAATALYVSEAGITPRTPSRELRKSVILDPSLYCMAQEEQAGI